jgi:apolipoprotein N-acyltransferase
MNIYSPKWINRGYAVLSGLLLTFSFPPFHLPWVAWFALVPLLRVIAGQSGREAFVLGMTAGLAHYFTLMYWIVVVLGHYGGLPWFASVSVLILFCLYLSAYMGAFARLSRDLCEGRFQVLGPACLWVGLELLRTHFLTGFPWCLLGHSQYGQLSLIQISDLVGVYGVSFLLVASNGVISLLFDIRSLASPFRKAETAAVVALLSLAFSYGVIRLKDSGEAPSGQREMKVAIVQGDIDQSVKWDPRYQGETVRIYEALSREAAPFHPDLILWPETAVPFFFQEASDLASRVSAVPRSLKATLIFGSPAYRMTEGGPQYLNRAYRISPEGEVSGYYDKIHLVPFGEYVPLKSLLFFVNRLVPAAGDFAAGETLAPLSGQGLSAGVLICFEVLFPGLSRGQVKKGADLLVNLTNDAWFGKTSAPYQHLAIAVFRAVENRTPMVRAANTGISAFIRPTGEITRKTGIFRKELLKGEVTLVKRPLGFYTRHGDLFALSLSLLSAIQIGLLLWYRRTRRSK